MSEAKRLVYMLLSGHCSTAVISNFVASANCESKQQDLPQTLLKRHLPAEIIVK